LTYGGGSRLKFFKIVLLGDRL